MKTQKRKIGDIGEQVAADYLKNNGYKILDRNYNRKWGEIDIVAVCHGGRIKWHNRCHNNGTICRDSDIITFVEVKTVKKGSKFRPEENIHFWKQKRLVNTAQSYLKENKISPEVNWQIDVVIVELNFNNQKANLRHIKNAVY